MKKHELHLILQIFYPLCRRELQKKCLDNVMTETALTRYCCLLSWLTHYLKSFSWEKEIHYLCQIGKGKIISCNLCVLLVWITPYSLIFSCESSSMCHHVPFSQILKSKYFVLSCPVPSNFHINYGYKALHLDLNYFPDFEFILWVGNKPNSQPL